jgi:hypothetical protein
MQPASSQSPESRSRQHRNGRANDEKTLSGVPTTLRRAAEHTQHEIRISGPLFTDEDFRKLAMEEYVHQYHEGTPRDEICDF